MSRCEHGQIISIFCLSKNCTWREAGGCEVCFKKYHSHPLNLDTISLVQLEELFKQLLVKPDIKLKSRPLQQAIYNYFMIMKSQISSSIDAVSREITNRLNYPYINREGQLGVFKKIKNREYKKIGKSELRDFYQFASRIQPITFEQQEKRIYLQEIQTVVKNIADINNIFSSYAEAISGIDNSFNIEKSFYDKIVQITSSISSPKQQSTTTDNSAKDATYTINVEPPKKNEDVIWTKPPRDRKVSLDVAGMNEVLSFKHTGNYEENEKEIVARKQRLMDMLNMQSGGTGNTTQTKYSTPEKRKFGEGESLTKEKNNHNGEASVAREFQDKEKTEQGNLFTDLAKIGINFTELIAHTALPAGKQTKPRLYEDTKDVKERKITVPMKIIEADEVSSPNFKKRKKQKNENGGGFNMMKVDSIEAQKNQTQTQSDGTDIIQTPKKNNREAQKLVLKDKQTDSLALLIESLSMPVEKAIPLLQASIKYAHNNLSAGQYLSYLYLEVQKPKECLDLCNKFLEQLEDSPVAKQLSVHISNNKAVALNKLGRYSESISILQRCLELMEKDIYYKNLGDSFFSTGIFEKAAYNYEKAIQMNHQMDEALYNLAVCHYMQDHLNQAQLNVQKALKISPKNDHYNQLNREIMIKLQI